jgi:hypothetical protein
VRSISFLLGVAIASCGTSESKDKPAAGETAKRARELSAQVVAVQAEIADGGVAIAETMKLVDAATTQADRDKAAAVLAALRDKHTEALERLRALQQEMRENGTVEPVSPDPTRP